MRKIDLTNFQVATSETARQINRRIALNFLRRQQPISRAELARRSGLQRSTVSSIIDQLIGEGWVTEGAIGRAARGRRPRFLHLNVERASIVAVELRPETTTVALAGIDARLAMQTSWPTPRTPAAFIRELARTVASFREAHPRMVCEGLGVSLPGRVDSSGRLVFAPNLGWGQPIEIRQPLELSWGRAHNSLDFTVRNPLLTRSAATVTGIPLLYPSAVQQDYIPDFRFNGGRVGGSAGYFQTDRGPFTNENTTHDAIVNLTKVWGGHASKAGFYFQSSYKPQSIFGSFNSQIDFIDDANNPFDTGFAYANAATGIFRFYTQASKYALPEWRYKNIEWFLQDNWKKDRLTLDYGVRFYHLTPQWDTTLQASNFVPERFDPSQAVRLFRPAIVNGVRVGIDPVTGRTVDARFIARIVPGSGNRFNGSFQAGQGIDEELQDGSSFRISPRLGVTYDLTGQAETILRGGFGILYDRPQGNMVFDMIANAPGVLVSSLQWGRLQDLAAGGGDPNAVLALNPTAFDFEPPKIYQWNVGVQHKLWSDVILDIAYVGSESRDLLRQVQINAVPRGATFLPQNQDPTRPPSTTPGATALPLDLLRPYPGYGNIRMWDYSGYSNYHALQTGVTRRFDNGFMFSGFYVWSKAQGINNDDFAAGAPNLPDEEVRRLDYSLLAHDRTHNFVTNFIYQTPRVSDGALGLLTNDWQISGIYRWTSGRPYGVGFSIPGIGNANLTGNDGNPGARVVLTCDPGRGWSGDPYVQLNTSCFAPPQPGSDGAESPRFFVRSPPINNLDLSISKAIPFPAGFRGEVRLDMFNALNHTQFTGVNATVNFASLTNPTITNLPYDANGNLVRQNGFGAINGVAPPRTLQLVMRLTF